FMKVRTEVRSRVERFLSLTDDPGAIDVRVSELAAWPPGRLAARPPGWPVAAPETATPPGYPARLPRPATPPGYPARRPLAGGSAGEGRAVRVTVIR
ncbi:hypothetical protein, partial [Micromonospora sp. NPDC003241]